MMQNPRALNFFMNFRVTLW